MEAGQAGEDAQGENAHVCSLLGSLEGAEAVKLKGAVTVFLEVLKEQ